MSAKKVVYDGDPERYNLLAFLLAAEYLDLFSIKTMSAN